LDPVGNLGAVGTGWIYVEVLSHNVMSAVLLETLILIAGLAWLYWVIRYEGK
jgi:hypothetical protein